MRERGSSMSAGTNFQGSIAFEYENMSVRVKRNVSCDRDITATASMSSTDFSSLPQYLQRRIDDAFDQSAPSSSSSYGGGFIPEASGGGFLPDNADSESPSQIALSAVPTALQRLDLPPDDEQVLVVFKNAASGWRSLTNRAEEIRESDGEEGAEKLWVSREDWRAVCAVLLEHHAEEYDDRDSDGVGAGDDQMYGDVDVVAGTGSGAEEEEDEYQEPEPDAESDSDSDEYVEESPSKRRRTRARTTTRRARSGSSSSASSTSPSAPKTQKLTARQTQSCLETYALFFPGASQDELATQRIGIKNIQTLSKLIGDNLKGAEIIEMLGEFSTAPDKTMCFADFGTMMVAAKLV
ncbi:hypothetical protein DFH06DRAFT_1197052 [Mycena polygramma]|nr:hypothetical protein DFH06DRAFT_1197052 [Mycena polygramma]